MITCFGMGRDEGVLTSGPSWHGTKRRVGPRMDGGRPRIRIDHGPSHPMHAGFPIPQPMAAPGCGGQPGGSGGGGGGGGSSSRSHIR
jgi:hypothetical protein